MPFRGIFDTVLYIDNSIIKQTYLAAFTMCIAYGDATGVPQLIGLVMVRQQENLFCSS
jgi:hypothetical protein